MPKKIFHDDASGVEMCRPRGPDWNEDSRSWGTMNCRAEWTRWGDRYEAALQASNNDLLYYSKLLEQLLEKLGG